MIFEYISKIAFSLALSSLSTTSSGDSLDTAKRIALESARAHDFLLLLLMTVLVAIGVALEGPEIAHETKTAWLRCRGKRRKVREAAPWITLAAAFGWLIIVIGVTGEGYWDARVSHDDQQILSFDESELENTEKAAGNAEVSAKGAADAASRAQASADAVEKTAEKEILERATLEAEFIKAEPRITLLNGQSSLIMRRLRPMAGQKYFVIQCHQPSDEEGGRTAAFFISLEVLWVKLGSPHTSNFGSCNLTGIMVSTLPNATEATRANAKALSSILEDVLTTGVTFDDKGKWDIEAILHMNGSRGVPIDEETIVIGVGEHPVPDSPPRMSGGERNNKIPSNHTAKP